MPYIYIKPIGKIDADVLDKVIDAAQARFKVPAKLDKLMEIPEEALNKKRKKYDASVIMDKLRLNLPKDSIRVLGVIDKDIFLPGYNYIFGIALPAYYVALISIARLREEFYELREDNKKLTERAIKEAFHELGHTFALSHCKNPKCVMFFSNSIADTDKKDREFCEECRKKARINRLR